MSEASSHRAVGLGAWLEVDLDALVTNLAVVERRLDGAGVLAVVKADAYGHGAVEVARTLAASGVERFAVARLTEGAALREGGVDATILLLGPLAPELFGEARRLELVPVLNGLEQIEQWASATTSSGAEQQPVQLKVDTGMTRLGIAPDELGTALGRIDACPGLRLSGLLSHLAEAESLESDRTVEQTRLFSELVAELPAARLETIDLHLANSGGALHHPLTRHSYARVGLALYGYDPVGEATGLRPVLSVHGRIGRLRRVPPGTRVGYGGTWSAARDSLIATVPIGYADGLPLAASNRGRALCRGRRIPIVGAVSMDLVTLDATDLPRVAEGDSVRFVDGAGGLPATDLATAAETSVYELLCRFGNQRLPRLYRRRCD